MFRGSEINEVVTYAHRAITPYTDTPYKRMAKILTYDQIDQQQWQELVHSSATATWFQTPEAYAFYASLPNEMMPFTVGVSDDNHLKGLVVGYTTIEKNLLKHFLTRRAIIIGGPLLDEHISDEALNALLLAIKKTLNDVIYIETRNFNDYSQWKSIFEQCGFNYQPHLNFHVDTTSVEVAQANIGKHRWKYIRLSIRDGATMVENPTIDQVREYYEILLDLYKTKVKTPLFSWEFFEKLYYQPNAKYLLVELEGKILGGAVCVCVPNKAVYEWFACGNDYYRKGIRPSSVATWYGIQYAALNGYPLFDFMGAGKPDEAYGVRDFKAEFGGKLVEHGRFLCVRNPLLYWIGKIAVKLLKRK